jgi:REP element-mobilizing transposase RayT
MPRHRRIIKPGSLVHVIPRFVDRVRVIVDDEDHLQYIGRLGRAFEATDWRLLAYALMGTHTHWFSQAGMQPFEAVAKPVHSGFARWSNRKHGRLGPILAERPSTYIVKPNSAARVVAYIHTNPVRAGIVRQADAYAWSSHRAFLGLADPVAALDVDLGLERAGFSIDPSRRAAFAEFIDSYDRRDDELLFSRAFDAAQRSRLSGYLGSAVELGTPTVDLLARQLRYPVVSEEGVPVRGRWSGSLDLVIQSTAELTGVRVEEIRSKGRSRRIVAARRLAVVTATCYLNRTQGEIAHQLGISAPSASVHIQKASTSCHREARRIAQAVRGSPGARKCLEK